MFSSVVTAMPLAWACAVGDSPSAGASCVKAPGAGREEAALAFPNMLQVHGPAVWKNGQHSLQAMMEHSGGVCCGRWFRNLGIYTQSLHAKAIKWLSGGINTVSSPDTDEINPITLAQITLWSYLMTSTMNDYDCFYSHALSQIHFWLPYQILTFQWGIHSQSPTGFTFHCVLRMGYLAPISLTSSASLFVYHLSVHIFCYCNTNPSKLLWHFLKAG